ncbi:MAG: peptidylprolyl isomerase [Burkholderiaceae bacterium]
MTLKTARLLALLIATAALPVFAQNVAVVNGKSIPTSRSDFMLKVLAAQGKTDSPELREQIKQELINREVLAQEAKKQGVGLEPEVKEQIDMQSQLILIRALIADYTKKNPVSDAAVKAEYDKAKADASNEKEYHARHILVDKEDEAKAIIAKLKAGEKFETLAKQSKDTGSAENGGDLDWSSPKGYVPEFSAAMTKLEKGQITETPVKTQFGYHVIKLEDVRNAQIPSFDEIKDKIKQSLEQQKLLAYQQDLMKKAKIK